MDKLIKEKEGAVLFIVIAPDYRKDKIDAHLHLEIFNKLENFMVENKCMKTHAIGPAQYRKNVSSLGMTELHVNENGTGYFEKETSFHKDDEIALLKTFNETHRVFDEFTGEYFGEEQACFYNETGRLYFFEWRDGDDLVGKARLFLTI